MGKEPDSWPVTIVRKSAAPRSVIEGKEFRASETAFHWIRARLASDCRDGGGPPLIGQRLVRFDRRRGLRTNPGPRGAVNATIHAQAKVGEAAKPGLSWRRSNSDAEHLGTVSPCQWLWIGEGLGLLPLREPKTTLPIIWHTTGPK